MSEHALTAADSFARLVAKVELRLPAPGVKLPGDYLERRYDAARLSPDERIALTSHLVLREMASALLFHDGFGMRKRRPK